MRIIGRQKQRALRLACAAVLAALAASFATLSAPEPAGAMCDGINQPVDAFGVVGSTIFAIEHFRSFGTCDGDRVYLGRVEDARTDGFCVNVQLGDNGTIYTPATACSSPGTSFNWTDKNSSGYPEAIERMCRVGGACGSWFRTHGY